MYFFLEQIRVSVSSDRLYFLVQLYHYSYSNYSYKKKSELIHLDAMVTQGGFFLQNK
jgi:hypothetical protein